MPGADQSGPGKARGTDGATTPANVVRLRGRVSTAPSGKELPRGSRIVTLRLSVARDRTPMTAGSTQSTDWVDCVAWGGQVRRTVAAWQVGDVVEVTGALRRRFYRGSGGVATRVEVELLSGRRLVKAAPATG